MNIVMNRFRGSQICIDLQEMPCNLLMLAVRSKQVFLYVLMCKYYLVNYTFPEIEVIHFVNNFF